jgi:death-on-curing protein
MSDPIEYLDLDDLIDLARKLLGDPPPIRDLGLLGSAAARPQATAFGQDAYPDLVAKAAALLQSIVNNHARSSTATSDLAGWPPQCSSNSMG